MIPLVISYPKNYKYNCVSQHNHYFEFVNMKKSYGRLAAKLGASAYGAYSKYRKRRGSRNSRPKSVPSTRRSTRLRSRRSRTRTRTKTKRKSETTSNPALFSALYKSTGRKLSSNVYCRKLVRDNVRSSVTGMSSCTPWGGVSGAQFLSQQNLDVTSVINCPLHLIELTGSPNAVGPTGAITYPDISWQLKFSLPTDLGLASFTKLGTNFTLKTYDQPFGTSIVDQFPHNRDLLDYINADFMFYCPTNASTRVSIDFIQLLRDDLHPTTANMSTFATSFWQSMIKRYMYSPLSILDSTHGRHFRTLKRLSFYMDPKETTEAGNAVTKRVKIFHRFNRKVTYAWQDADRVAMEADDSPVNIGSNQTQPEPKARIYMMIRAQAQTDTVNINTKHPSYDIQYRQKHSTLS